MSKPRLLDAYTKDSNTITTVNADYAEIGEWSDGNPDDETRIGYFVSVDESKAGVTMIKSTSHTDVRGVTIEYPGFSTNANRDKFDESGRLLPRYSYIGLVGFVTVIDNGTCTVNGRCMPADDGTAVPSSNNLGYQVIERIDSTHVLILVEPQGDVIQRIKSDVGVVITKAEYDALPDDVRNNGTYFVKDWNSGGGSGSGIEKITYEYYLAHKAELEASGNTYMVGDGDTPAPCFSASEVTYGDSTVKDAIDELSGNIGTADELAQLPYPGESIAVNITASLGRNQIRHLLLPNGSYRYQGLLYVSSSFAYFTIDLPYMVDLSEITVNEFRPAGQTVIYDNNPLVSVSGNQIVLRTSVSGFLNYNCKECVATININIPD